MEEAKRVFNVKFIVIISMLFILNGIILISDNHKQAGKSAAFGDIVNMAATYKKDGTYREAVITAYKEYRSVKGTAESVKYARNLALEKADYIDSYNSDVETKISNATTIIGSNIYGKDSFESINLLKSRYDLITVKDKELKLGNGIWLEKLCEYKYVHILVVIIMCLTVFSFFEERKYGLYYIIHTGKKGRLNLLLTRIIILITEGVIVSALFYAETITILLGIYGGVDDIGELALNDKMFCLVAGDCTRIQFSIVLMLVSAVFAIAISLSLWFMFTLFSNVNIGLIVYMLVCGIEVIIYNVVPIKTIFRFLHYINIYYLLYPINILRYENWGYSFGITDVFQSSILLALAVIIFSVCANVYRCANYYYSGKKNVFEALIDKLSCMVIKMVGELPMGIKEGYKVLISQKTIIILCILFGVILKIDAGVSVNYSLGMAYECEYYIEAEGLSYGKELEDIYEKYELEYKEFVEGVDTENQHAAEIIANRGNILKNIRNNVDYLKYQKEHGVDAKVMNPYEYLSIFGKNQTDNQKLLALINVIAAVAISAGFMSYEKKNGMNRIVFACKERRRWLIRKMLANFGLIAVFCMASYGVYYYRLSKVYKFSNITFPIKSLTMFERLSINPSIIGFILLHILMIAIIMFSISVIISALSYKVKYIYCMCFGLTMIIPQLLNMMGFEKLEKLSIGKYIGYFPVFNYNTGSMMEYYGFVICLVGVAVYLEIRLIINS